MSNRFTRAIAIAIVFASTPVHAQPANEDKARAAFNDALHLRDTDHKPQEALDRFRLAYQLAPTPRTGYELGKTLLALGDLVAARRAFQEVVAMPPDPLASQAGRDARDEAKRLEADLARRIPAIVIKLTGARGGGAVSVSVRVDGAPVPPEAIGAPWKVNPGPHAVVVKVGDDPERTQDVSVAEGATAAVEIDLSAPPAPSTATPPPTAPAPVTSAQRPDKPTTVANEHSSSSGQKTAALAVAGVGVVGLGTSGILALLAKSKFDDANCSTATNPPTCPNQAAVSQTSSAKTMADVATVVAAAGAVAVGVGAVLWIAAPSPATTVGFGPSGVVVRGRF